MTTILQIMSLCRIVGKYEGLSEATEACKTLQPHEEVFQNGLVDQVQKHAFVMPEFGICRHR